MNTRRGFLKNLMLLPFLTLLTACTDTLSLVEAIVSAAEVVLPSILPAYASQISLWLNQAMQIINDLTSTTLSNAAIIQADNDFHALLQQIPQLPPQAQAIISSVATAITNFITSTQKQVASGQVNAASQAIKVNPTSPKVVKVSKKAEAIRVRAMAVQRRLAAH